MRLTDAVLPTSTRSVHYFIHLGQTDYLCCGKKFMSTTKKTLLHSVRVFYGNGAEGMEKEHASLLTVERSPCLQLLVLS